MPLFNLYCHTNAQQINKISFSWMIVFGWNDIFCLPIDTTAKLSPSNGCSNSDIFHIYILQSRHSVGIIIHRDLECRICDLFPAFFFSILLTLACGNVDSCAVCVSYCCPTVISPQWLWFWFVCANTDFQGNPRNTLVTDFHSNSVCLCYFSLLAVMAKKTHPACLTLVVDYNCRAHFAAVCLQIWYLSYYSDACFHKNEIYLMASSSLSVYFIQSPMKTLILIPLVLVNCRKALVAGFCSLLQQAVWKEGVAISVLPSLRLKEPFFWIQSMESKNVGQVPLRKTFGREESLEGLTYCSN